jgi:hypothetical protein
MICDNCGKPFHGEAHKLGPDTLCANCFQDIRQFRRKLRLILVVVFLGAVALIATIHTITKLWPPDNNVLPPRMPGVYQHYGD